MVHDQVSNVGACIDEDAKKSRKWSSVDSNMAGKRIASVDGLVDSTEIFGKDAT